VIGRSLDEMDEVTGTAMQGTEVLNPWQLETQCRPRVSWLVCGQGTEGSNIKPSDVGRGVEPGLVASSKEGDGAV